MSRVSATTKRLLAVALLVLAGLVVLVLGTGASGGGSTYEVRAIFDNASFVVPGEDVKVAGVKVGAVESLDVTADHKAVIVLRIDDPAFQDFKRDASCTIRLQSLIGEKFVACLPTQPHDANAQPEPPLAPIANGPSKGQRLLPVTQTSSPVDVDLLSDIMRVPERQRLAIIVNELGVGLAGNGQELRAVIRRADPALAQFDKVLAILASQNRVLANLSTESDAALAPLAAQSASISDFVAKAGQTATATAERGDALEQNFAKLPAFLAQLRPTAQRLGEFAAAGTPVFANLRAAAPSINSIFAHLGPFSEAALPTFRSLGSLSDAGRVALTRAEPVIQDIRAFATEAKPLASNLARGLTSVQSQHGIERLLDVVLFTTGTTNGFSSLDHYVRTFLYTNGCSSYATIADTTCSARLADSSDVANAPLPQPKLASSAASAASTPVVDPAPATPAATDSPSAAGTTAPTPTAGLLGYLLGNGGGQ